MIHKVSSLKNKQKHKKAVVSITPSVAIKNGLIKVVNKQKAVHILQLYGKFVGEKLLARESYSIILNDYASTGTIINLLIVQTKKDRSYLSRVRVVQGDQIKFILDPYLRLDIHTKNGKINKNKIAVSKAKTLKEIMNSMPVVERYKFPKQ